ncbi:alanine racemase [Sphingosinicella microcystinivorans]|uniref:Alanine racemase n=2 Tax=Sphingosinicella microcystinivorans TaxID=335406 RepID=A0AAD1G2F3_SPHMI|nr:D-serine deaminase-like pyridoxal phosphate-dependent protein [Sphingosinicella microcystinivorans]BBE35684.1 alanine racemase [Sphingosinicella microcystinivorans]
MPFKDDMTPSPQSLLQAPTPALVLDEARLTANIRRMEDHLAPFDVVFRPHVKTAKSPDVLRTVFGGTGPITVSTLLEAQMFAEAGFDDILYAVGIVPAKLDAVRTLADAGVRMQIILDEADVAHAVADTIAGNSGITVLIEVDCDGHRSGVAPEADDLLVIGRTLADAGLLCGVLTHAGESYSCQGADAIAAHAEIERAGLVRAAERLRAAGLPCPVVSMGSTPTALFVQALDGITEVRAGVYMFQDLVMAGIGVCQPEEIALSVLATVIGYQKAQGRLVIDAGWMAMSRDRGTAAQRVDQGYGLVCDAGGTIIGDLIVTGANQEHGLVGHRDGTPLDFSAYPIGTRLRILPNHACATAAQHPAYLLSNRDGMVRARWPRFSGWM